MLCYGMMNGELYNHTHLDFKQAEELNVIDNIPPTGGSSV